MLDRYEADRKNPANGFQRLSAMGEMVRRQIKKAILDKLQVGVLARDGKNQQPTRLETFDALAIKAPGPETCSKTWNEQTTW